ncbi:MAG: tRNA-dihydrouridine synthase, partial [Chloroflexi bacterium]|nr:tRNA-dihydrouridine synthase [Chloroflexota bacterium]
VNMGCPVRKIVKKGKGSALMRDLPRTAEILSSMRKALSIPLTIKIRGGWDDEHLNAVEVAQVAEGEGVDAITVHPRTRSQQFTGVAPWRIIGEVVDAVTIPVIGNGDVTSMPEARRMMAETGCQSVMIGRGAMGRPWVFSDEYQSLGREDQDEYRLNVIDEHMELIQEHLDERRALIQMKKNLSWYISTGWRARFRRRELFECATAAEAWDVFRRYWDLRLFEEEKLAAAAG